MNSWGMRARRALRLSFLLVGLCQAHRAPPPGAPSASREAGEVPVSQLRMLSLGLAHLLQGLVENAEQLERQGEQVAAELDGAAESLEGLRKHSLQAGRTHRQVRKDLQIMSARGDRLWRAARDLQKGLEDLEREQGTMQRRTNRIFQKVKSLTEPRSGGQTPLHIASMKFIMDKQARRLDRLTSEVSARDRTIGRRLRHIDHLSLCVSLRCRRASQQHRGQIRTPTVSEEHSCINTAALKRSTRKLPREGLCESDRINCSETHKRNLDKYTFGLLLNTNSAVTTENYMTGCVETYCQCVVLNKTRLCSKM